MGHGFDVICLQTPFSFGSSLYEPRTRFRVEICHEKSFLTQILLRTVTLYNHARTGTFPDHNKNRNLIFGEHLDRCKHAVHVTHRNKISGPQVASNCLTILLTLFALSIIRH